jgi:hypothetical protein
LDEVDPLTLDQIYIAVDRDLAARNLPRPQRRAVNAAGDLALSRGITPARRVEQPNIPAVQFGRTYTLVDDVLRAFQSLFFPLLNSVTFSITLLFLAILEALLFINVFWLFGTGVSGLLILFSRLSGLIPRGKDVQVRELVVDRSGLTVRWKRDR